MIQTELDFSKIDDILPSGYTVVGSTPEHVLGHWINTNPSTGLIKEVIIQKEGEDYIFQVYGLGKDGLIDWGKSTALTYYSNIHANTIEGFTTTFDLGFMEIQLSANVKYGVLVLQMFSRFKDNSKRQNYYAREFYVRACSQNIEPDNILIGKWKNTRAETTSIAGFEIVPKDNKTSLIQIKCIENGALLNDWGHTEVYGYAKSTDSKNDIGWWAKYDLQEFVADLSINYNKGLIIIAAMIKYKNQPESSGVFIREFFAKEIE